MFGRRCATAGSTNTICETQFCVVIAMMGQRAELLPDQLAYMDKWPKVKLGDPLPPNPVRLPGHQNMYPAMWRRPGRRNAARFGRIWCNAGVMECSFSREGKECNDSRMLRGQEVQILTTDCLPYEAYQKLGFVYDYVPYRLVREDGRVTNAQHLLLVKSNDLMGPSTSAIMYDDKGQELLANFSIRNNRATVAYQTKRGRMMVGREHKMEAFDNIQNLPVLVRNITGVRSKWQVNRIPNNPRMPPVYKIMEDQWIEMNQDIKFPAETAIIRALDRPLNGPEGPLSTYVAMWHMNDQSVFGYIWSNGGKIAASFGVTGLEYYKSVGTVQVLYQLPPHIVGFKYKWQPFNYDVPINGWYPVTVKGLCCCVVKREDGTECVASLLPLDVKATCGKDGKMETFEGDIVLKSFVLCRKDDFDENDDN